MTAQAKGFLPQAKLASGSPIGRHGLNTVQLVILCAASALHKNYWKKQYFLVGMPVLKPVLLHLQKSHSSFKGNAVFLLSAKPPVVYS